MKVAKDVPAQTYSLTIKGTAGTLSHTAQLALTVTERGFTLTVIPEDVFIQQGGSDDLIINIERTTSFSEGVTLALEGAPAGVSSVFAPNPVTASSSTLTLDVADTVAAGSYTLTLKGTSGSYSSSTTVTLVVTSTTAPGFTLSLNPTTLTLQQGQQGTVAVTIERTGGFTELVTLSAALKPDAQHITVTFAPTQADASSTMTIVVGNNVPTRTYLLEVRGLAGTVRDTAPLTLVVTSK